MAVADLLQTISNSRVTPPLSPVSFKQQPTPKFNLNPRESDSGSLLQTILQNSKNNAQTTYTNYRQGVSGDVAKNVLAQSAGTVDRDKYGIVQPPTSNYASTAQSNLAAIDQTGKTALQGAQDEATFKQLVKQQNLAVSASGATYNPSYIPAGATPDNKGAQAVAIAMTAYNNKTPYVWGGNSLQNGVDCSGLMQQVYAKLGIKLPRTTYEQAKSGQIIQGGVENALPGDMIFYNTGSSDPNGIGKNSHVAMYIGNGMILEAYNSKVGIREASATADGTPSTIVRPWS